MKLISSNNSIWVISSILLYYSQYSTFFLNVLKIYFKNWNDNSNLTIFRVNFQSTTHRDFEEKKLGEGCISLKRKISYFFRNRPYFQLVPFIRKILIMFHLMWGSTGISLTTWRKLLAYIVPSKIVTIIYVINCYYQHITVLRPTFLHWTLAANSYVYI